MIDFEAQLAWLTRFIRDDAFNSPNMFISACDRIRTCPSWMLRDAAWKEVQRLGQPIVRANPKKPDGHQKTQSRVNKAYDALKSKMLSNPEGFRKGSERVPEPPNVNAHVGAGEISDDDEPMLCSVAGCSGLAGADGRCADCVAGARR
jgi:hypothetical protein